MGENPFFPPALKWVRGNRGWAIGGHLLGGSCGIPTADSKKQGRIVLAIPPLKPVGFDI